MKLKLTLLILALMALASCNHGPGGYWANQPAGTYHADMTDNGDIIVTDTRMAACWISRDGGETWEQVKVK